MRHAMRAGQRLTNGLSSRLAAPCLCSTRDFAQTVDYRLTDIGEGIFEVEVLDWYVQEGDTVEEMQKLCEVQSDKANVEMPSKYPGVIKKIPTAQGEMLQVGSTLCVMEVPDGVHVEPKDLLDGPATAPAKKAPSSAPTSSSGAGLLGSFLTPAAPDTSAHSGKVLMTPATRRIIRENNLDPSIIPVTGKGGRLLKEDVIHFMAGKTTAVPPAAAVTAAPITVAAPIGEDYVESIKGIKRIMVQTMTAANAVPCFGYGDEYDMTKMVELRRDLKAQGIKVSYMPFFIKAASLALRNYPMLNAHVNADCSELTHRASHNIGIAVDTPTGLLVPNIKNVESKSISQIDAELSDLAARGREGKIAMDELKGGTFTISNIGAIGGTYCSPVVVVPEVCIVALGGIQRLPRFDSNGAVTAQDLLAVSFSADHRVIDGATVARFSNEWKSYLAQPGSMLMHLK